MGRNLQCAHNANLSGPLDLIAIGDDVAIQSGAYVSTTRWAGQELHVGPVRLESGCKIGMRAAVAGNVTVGQGTWITPFTPIFSDVGAHEMWEGAPARLGGRYTELKRTASIARDAAPVWLLETGNIAMQVLVFLSINLIPTAVILWLARGLLPFGETAELAEAYFQTTPLPEIALHLTLYAFVSGWAIVVVTSVLQGLFIRWMAFAPGLYAARGLKGALLGARHITLRQVDMPRTFFPAATTVWSSTAAPDQLPRWAYPRRQATSRSDGRCAPGPARRLR